MLLQCGSIRFPLPPEYAVGSEKAATVLRAISNGLEYANVHKCDLWRVMADGDPCNAPTVRGLNFEITGTDSKISDIEALMDEMQFEMELIADGRLPHDNWATAVNELLMSVRGDGDIGGSAKIGHRFRSLAADDCWRRFLGCTDLTRS